MVASEEQFIGRAEIEGRNFFRLPHWQYKRSLQLAASCPRV